MAKSKTKARMSEPWNKGVEVGQRHPFTPSEVNRIRKKLDKRGAAGLRDLALFSTAIDTMLRAPDLLRLTVKDVRKRNKVMRDTIELDAANRGRSISCTLSEAAREALNNWIEHADKKPGDSLFTGQSRGRSQAISARQLSRLVKEWAASIGLDTTQYGIESLRRTRSVYILKRTGDLEAVRLLLGLKDVEAVARYLSLSESDNALEISRANEL